MVLKIPKDLDLPIALQKFTVYVPVLTLCIHPRRLHLIYFTNIVWVENLRCNVLLPLNHSHSNIFSLKKKNYSHPSLQCDFLKQICMCFDAFILVSSYFKCFCFDAFILVTLFILNAMFCFILCTCHFTNSYRKGNAQLLFAY